MKLEGIDHIALSVSDVDRSVAWYQEVLGLERRFDEAWGNHPAFVGIGTTALALFPTTAAQSKQTRGRDRISMRHLAFRADRANFEKAQAELRGHGVSFTFQDHEISHSIYFLDPDGHEIEITTYEIRGQDSGARIQG